MKERLKYIDIMKGWAMLTIVVHRIVFMECTHIIRQEAIGN